MHIDLHFTEIKEHADKLRHLPLLLDADPSEEMIARYLDKGRMFIARHGDETAGEIVVVQVEQDTYEIKNIAVAPHLRGSGVGKALIKHVEGIYQGKYKTLLVGTSVFGTGFYKACGFTDSHVVTNFFTDNYPDPIYENGVLIADMIYLKKAVTK